MAAAGVTVPAHVVAAVVEVPFGAHPSSCYPGYAYDRPHLAEYVAAATAGPDAVTAYLERYVLAEEDAYRALVGSGAAHRLVDLGRGVDGAVPMSGWTFDEWFVVALARTIVDREVVFHGFASPCAQVAMHVARRTHAPGSLLIEGATYAVNPEPAFVPPTGNDLALHRDAAYRMRFDEFFDAACRGDVDRMFLSGGQIDAHGNTNVTAIGGMPNPKIKLGGGGGGANISATIGALTLWTTRHRSGRTLVPHPRLPHGPRARDAVRDPRPSSATPAAARSGSSPSSGSSTSSTAARDSSRRSPTSTSRTSGAPPASSSTSLAEVASRRRADGGRAGARAGDRPARRTPVEFSEQELARSFGQPAPGDRYRPLLDALFAPRRVALVGASDRAGSLGALLAANLASFPGEVVRRALRASRCAISTGADRPRRRRRPGRGRAGRGGRRRRGRA